MVTSTYLLIYQCDSSDSSDSSDSCDSSDSSDSSDRSDSKQSFQSFFLITNIATYRLNQPRGQITWNA